MSPDHRARRAPLPWPAVLAAVLLTGACAAPVPAPPAAAARPPHQPPAPPPHAAPPAEPAVSLPVQGGLPGGIRTDSSAEALTLLGFADRLRRLQPPEVAAEVQRLSDKPEAMRQPADDLQLALALAHTRTAGDLTRAQGLLQKVLGDNRENARGLHPLAGLLAARYAEQRRLEELNDRQAQQLREQQRRIDQLTERLEAVRAVERSLAPRPPVNGVQTRPAQP